MAKKRKPIIPREGEINDFATIGTHVRDGKVIYLDIETTGLTPGRDKITTVAILDGNTCHHFTRDENLKDLTPYLEANREKAICTFNGTRFDLPFIEQETGIAITNRTIDAYLLSSERLFIPGGLKKLRKGFGWTSVEEQNSGSDAIWLWDAWQREGDRAYRSAMLEYCADDVLSLRFVLAHLFNLWAAGRGIEPLAVPPVPNGPPSALLQDIAGRRAITEKESQVGTPYASYIEVGRTGRAARIHDADVQDRVATGTNISATVVGSGGINYTVKVEAINGGTRVHCDCLDFAKNEHVSGTKQQFCKHVIKVLALATPEQVSALFPEGTKIEFSFR